MNQSALDTLLEAAVLAPSGDNTQPWRFTVNREHGSIAVDVDATRDPSPMNAGQRMARLAIGAAVENMVRTAERNQWQHRLSVSDDRVEITLDQPYGSGDLDPVLGSRRTNRKRYRGTSIANVQWERLRELTPAADSTTVEFIPRGESFALLTELVSRADSLIFSSKLVRKAFLDNVRFDMPAKAVVDYGLSLGSLEIARPQQFALRAMRYTPDGVLRALGGGRIFKQAAASLAQSASGFCLITSTETGRHADFYVGRTLQRAWLAFTQEQLAAQPMMSLLVVQNMLDHASPALDPDSRQAAETLLHDFHQFVATISNGRPGGLLRFGICDESSVRTGRLSVSTSIHEPG